MVFRVPIFASIFSSTRPSLSFSSGPSGPTNDSTPTFTLGVTNSSGSYSLSYQINGVAPVDCLVPLANVLGAVTTINLATIPDGSYDIYACIYDSVYSYGSVPQSRSFSVDTVAPKYFESSQPDNASDSVEGVNYVFTADGNGYSITYAGGCSSITTTTSSVSYPLFSFNTLEFSGMSDGMYANCEITLTDSASNATVISLPTFTIDTGEPSIQIDYDAELGFDLIANQNNGGVNTTTPVFGVKSYSPTLSPTGYYQVNGVAPVDCSSPLANSFVISPYLAPYKSGNFAPVGLINGVTYNVYLCAKDGGNYSEVVKFTFTVDTVAPTMTQSAPIGSTNDNTPNYSVSVAADTSPNISLTFGGGCTSSTTTFDTGAAGTITFDQLADGTYASCTIDYEDLAQNAGATLNVTSFTVDDLPSVTTFSPIDGAVEVSASSNLVVTFDQVMTVVGGTITIKNSGGSTFESYALPSGNVTGTGSNTITINPTASFVSDSVYYVEISAGALQDPQANAYAGFSGAGTWDFTVVDTTAPTISVVTPIPSPDNDSTPDFVFTTNESGTIGFSGGAHCVSASSVFKTTGSDTISLDTLITGSYSACSITVTDGAGNVSNSISTGAFDVDLASPSISSMTYPNPTNDTTPTFTFSVNDAGGAYISGIDATSGTLVFTINAIAYNESSSELALLTGTDGSQNTTWSFTPPALSQGVYPFTVVANDMAGNSATTYVGSLTIDTTPPTVLTNVGSVIITSNTPSSGYASIGSVVTVQFEGSEHLTNVAGTIEGNTASFSNPSGNIWQATYTFVGGETEGVVSFNITFDDSSGNSGSSSAVTTGGDVIYDETIPTIDNLSFMNPTNDTTPTITFDVLDSGDSGVDTSSVNLTYDGVTYFVGANLAITSGTNGDPIVSFEFTQPSVLSDGSYVFDIDADDLSGNSAVNYANSQTVDTVSPDVTLTYTADPTPTGTQTVTANFTESMAISPTIDIDQPGSTDISGVAMTLGVTSWTYDYTVNATNGGTYIDGMATVNINGTDLAGNALNIINNPTFFIDTVSPDVTLTYTADPISAGVQSITATFSEPMDVLVPLTISIDQPGSTDISNVTMSGGPTIWTYNYTVNTANGGTYIDGVAGVSLDGLDPAGNPIDTVTNPTFVIDTTAPDVTLSYTADPKSAGIQTITATFSEPMLSSPTLDINQPGSTDISGGGMAGGPTIWTYNYTVVTANGGTYIDGTATITVNGTDLALNPVDGVTNPSFVIDTTQPDVTLSYTTSPSNAGLMIVTATFSEPVMNSPTIAINQPGSTDISATSMSGGSSVWTYNYTVNAANGGTYIDGTATVTIAGYDIAGNALDATTNPTFEIDTTNPTVALTYSADPTAAGVMTITATFNEAIVTTPFIIIDQPGTVDSAAGMGGGPLVWTSLYTVNTDDGSDYLDGTAMVDITGGEDSAGNENDGPTNDSFDIDTIDPIITIDPYGDPSNDTTPTITFSVDDLGAAGVDTISVLFTIDAIVYDETDPELTLLSGTNGSQNTSWSFTSPVLDPDGIFGFQIDAQDTVSNATMESNTIKIDTQNPVITLDSYTNPSQISTPVFTFSIEDEALGSGVDVDSIVFRFNSIDYDNSDPELVVTGNNGDLLITAVFTTPATIDGSYNFSIDADDVATNSGGQVTGSIDIDTLAPILTEVTPIAHATNDTTPNYTFNTTEDGFISYIGGCIDTSSSVALTGDVTVTFEELEDDRYYCDIEVTDLAGNVGTLSVRSFEVDTEAIEIGPIVLVHEYGDPQVSWFSDFSEEPHNVHVEIVFNGNDDEEDIIDLSPGDEGVEIDGERLFFAPPEAYVPGEYTFTLRGSDEAGNEADPESYTYIVEPNRIEFIDVSFDAGVRVLNFGIEDNGKGINLSSLSVAFSQGALSNVIRSFTTGSSPAIVCLPAGADFDCSLGLSSVKSDFYMAALSVMDNEALVSDVSYTGVDLRDEEVVVLDPQRPQITGYSFSSDQDMITFEVLKGTNDVNLSTLSLDFAYQNFDSILQSFATTSMLPIQCTELTNGYDCQFSTRLLVPDNYLIRVEVSDENNFSAFPFITGISIPADFILLPDEASDVPGGDVPSEPENPGDVVPAVDPIIRPDGVVSQIEDIVDTIKNEIFPSQPLGPLVYNFVYNSDFKVLSFTIASRVTPAEIRSLELSFKEKILGATTVFDTRSNPPVRCFQTDVQYDCVFRTNTLKPGEYVLTILVLDEAGATNDPLVIGLDIPESIQIDTENQGNIPVIIAPDQTDTNTDIILNTDQFPLDSDSPLSRISSGLYEVIKFISDATEYAVLMAYLDPYRQGDGQSDIAKIQAVDPQASIESVVPAIPLAEGEKKVFDSLLNFATEAIDTIDRALTDYVFKSFVPRDNGGINDPVNQELQNNNELKSAIPVWMEF